MFLILVLPLLQPPQVRFASRINLGCVATDGTVNARSFHILSHWNRGYTMETVLVELRKEMASAHNRRLPQPAENSMY